jgi:hypothetical protein
VSEILFLPEDIAPGNLLETSNLFEGVRIFVLLKETKDDVYPEETLNNLIEYQLEYILRLIKCDARKGSYLKIETY